jgi:hypothetical protein
LIMAAFFFLLLQPLDLHLKVSHDVVVYHNLVLHFLEG